jgi:hypothetical protein
MIDFTNRDLFTPVTHPESGVTIYVLTRRVAPLQQGFYFVNNSMSDDGRYLWFHCAFPPSLGRTLGVVDFQTGEVRHFPETQFGGPYSAPPIPTWPSLPKNFTPTKSPASGCPSPTDSGSFAKVKNPVPFYANPNGSHTNGGTQTANTSGAFGETIPGAYVSPMAMSN